MNACRWIFNDDDCKHWYNGHWSLMEHQVYGDDNVRVKFWPKGSLSFVDELSPSDLRCMLLVRRDDSGSWWPIPDEFMQRVSKYESLFLSAADGQREISFDNS
jgi:hypothetical protein